VLSLYHLHRLDPWLVVALLALVACGDSAAFFVGSWIGRHKMAPRVSPNKSWEGAVASWLAAVTAVGVWAWYYHGAVEPGWLIAAAVTAPAAQLGDLVESLVKRGAGVKDSSDVLPGHGGIYDRLDALLLAAPVFALALWGLGLASSAETLTAGTP
jgi:phosphatidate cytidylyltransferase